MKRALVLEDEPAISEFVEINLIRAGYDVLTAGTGEEARAKETAAGLSACGDFFTHSFTSCPFPAFRPPRRFPA